MDGTVTIGSQIALCNPHGAHLINCPPPAIFSISLPYSLLIGSFFLFLCIYFASVHFFFKLKCYRILKEQKPIVTLTLQILLDIFNSTFRKILRFIHSVKLAEHRSYSYN